MGLFGEGTARFKSYARGSMIEPARLRNTAKLPEMRVQLFKSSPEVKMVHDMLRADPHILFPRITDVMSPKAYKKAHGLLGLRGPPLERQEEYVRASKPFVMRMENGRVVTRDIDPVKLAEAEAGLREGEVLVGVVKGSYRRVSMKVKTAGGITELNLKFESPRRKVRPKDVIVGRAMEKLGVGSLKETAVLYGEFEPPKNGFRLYRDSMSKRSTFKFYLTEVPRDITPLTNLDIGKASQILHNKYGSDFDSAGDAEKHEMRRQLMFDAARGTGKVMCDLHNVGQDYETKLHGLFSTYAHDQNFAISEKDGSITPRLDFSDVTLYRLNKAAQSIFEMGDKFPNYKYKAKSVSKPVNILLRGKNRQKKDLKMIALQLSITLKYPLKELGIGKKELYKEVLRGYKEQWEKRNLGKKPPFLR